MKKSVLILIGLFALVFSNCFALNTDRSEQAPFPNAGPLSEAEPVFVFSPVLIQAFKENINASIRRDPKLSQYIQISAKDFFDTATAAVKSTPRPYLGPCYLPKKANQPSLRTAGTKDSQYARTLALLIRIFPAQEEWSFDLDTPKGRTSYRFVRSQALQKAKSYLLAWSSRNPQQDDHLIPGVTPRHANCPGESQRSTQGKQGMEAGILAYSFVSAYELLYPYLSVQERADFTRWITRLQQEIIEGRNYWTVHAQNYPNNFSNHFSFHLLGLVSIAAATGNRNLLRDAVDGTNRDIVDSLYLKSMIEGAVYVQSECSKERYKTNPVCTIFRQLHDLGSRETELKHYPKITQMGCGKKHYYPRHQFPQTGEIQDRYRRMNKMGGSCAGKGMYYALEHLKVLTVLTLAADLNGFPMKGFVGKNGETLLSSYRFYGRCLADIHKDNYHVSDKIEPCEYYRGNLYPKHLISTFHLANHLWPLNSKEAIRIMGKDDQPLDSLNPLGHAQILGFAPAQ